MKFSIQISLCLGFAVLPVCGLPVTHMGMCDASAGVSVGKNQVLVANDEDNVLRLYSVDKAGAPLQLYDVGTFVQVSGKSPEIDMEGATRLGNHSFWISSHGNNKKGKQRSNRHALFALDLKPQGTSVHVQPFGVPYRDLVGALMAWPSLAPFRFDLAARLAPKESGGLNIEGLAATPQGALLIGFRSPVPQGKALLVPLLNPVAVVQGESPRFGEPILLDLGGNGIRSIEYSESRHGYWIVSGAIDGAGRFRLYFWSGKASQNPQNLGAIDFQDLRPEGLVEIPGDLSHVLLISDDGTTSVNGKECKEAPAGLRSFRTMQFLIPDIKKP